MSAELYKKKYSKYKTKYLELKSNQSGGMNTKFTVGIGYLQSNEFDKMLSNQNNYFEKTVGDLKKKYNLILKDLKVVDKELYTRIFRYIDFTPGDNPETKKYMNELVNQNYLINSVIKTNDTFIDGDTSKNPDLVSFFTNERKFGESLRKLVAKKLKRNDGTVCVICMVLIKPVSMDGFFSFLKKTTPKPAKVNVIAIEDNSLLKDTDQIHDLFGLR